jgi:hypothetical protein
MPLISLITDPAVGGTFLAWSILRLSGQDHHYHVKSNSTCEVGDNPLTERNAHQFAVNHATSLNELQQCVDTLRPLSQSTTQIVYLHNFERGQIDIDSDNKWPFDPVLDQKTVDLACTHSDYMIRVRLSSQYHRYHTKWEPRKLRKKWQDASAVNQTADQQNHDFIEFFFGRDYAIWKSQGLDQIWDLREFLALNMPPAQPGFSDERFDHCNYYGLEATENWFCLDQAMPDLLKHVGVELVEDRWSSWLSLYRVWSRIHYDRMRFVWAFDRIIQAILNGQNLALDRFDLDLMREAAIQHHLLYHHNLNLRSYGLKKFTNTQQLHQLLEPNTYHTFVRQLSKTL